ncbi:unnamed protein product [Zymoseptoria tritici ST99CH_1E4]|uniref:C2H2-type domain-containing protein n=1 Tax=Zymoseptoria tritici ST99CH_1E4 TaxID=1276532 RepID=A0A2H1GXG8_ZYMTR|nr:unnamed protein product [Zymoseptoria tritici ST99CH_1E4]
MKIKAPAVSAVVLVTRSEVITSTATVVWTFASESAASIAARKVAVGVDNGTRSPRYRFPLGKLFKLIRPASHGSRVVNIALPNWHVNRAWRRWTRLFDCVPVGHILQKRTKLPLGRARNKMHPTGRCKSHVSTFAVVPRSLRQLNANDSLSLDLSLPSIAQLLAVGLAQVRHKGDILSAVPFHIFRQRTLVEDGVRSASGRIEQLPALVFDGLPLSFLGMTDSVVAVDTLGETVDAFLGEVSGCQFHQLQVFDAGDADPIQTVQGIGVVADVEEDLDDVGRFHDGLERPAIVVRGAESLLSKRGDIDEVDVLLRFEQNRDKRQGARARQVVAFQVYVESRWLPEGLAQTTEKIGQSSGGVDKDWLYCEMWLNQNYSTGGWTDPLMPGRLYNKYRTHCLAAKDGSISTLLGAFRCEHCQKTFDKAYLLNKHIKKHTRPAKCPHCAYASDLEADVRRHCASQHPEAMSSNNAYYCPVAGCKKSRGFGPASTRKDNLNRHIRNSHPGVPLLP